jgi:hypothetical protein
MALQHELLWLSKILANREPKHPRQVSLRRALSTAYYALFHALIFEAVSVLAPAQPSKLRPQIGRAFAHTEMKKVCAGFSQDNIASLPDTTKALVVSPIRPEIKLVASTFVDLYSSRHDADYDTLATSFSKTDVIIKINKAEKSFAALVSIRGEPNSNVFLAALFFNKHWHRD